jgi:hypothetical protein
MTDHPPTMTHAELTELETSLRRLSQLIFDSPSWGANTALGTLAESDDDTITAAAKVVRRLVLDAKYPGSAHASYLPVRTLSRVQS